MVLPLMPKATAVWLVENTALTFQQIADFCGLHPLEVQAIADEEVAIGINGLDPVVNGQLTAEEIKRCEADESAGLQMAEATTPRPLPKTDGPRYTPIAKRQERPDAIAWLLRHYPELTDAQISRLIGTTKSTITAVRERTHWKSTNIKPVDPVDIGMCSYEDLLLAVQTARRRLARAEQRARREAARREREAAKAAVESESVPAETPPSPPTAPEAPQTGPANSDTTTGSGTGGY
ncbi:MAG: cell cycle transcriptional regulator TrcR [Alphaproteobacteria bacterium]